MTEDATRPAEYWVAIQDHPSELIQWILLNVVVGSASVWLPLFVAPIFGQSPASVAGGGLAIFVTTLCGTQVSVLYDVEEKPFRRLSRMLQPLFYALAIASAVLATAATFRPPSIGGSYVVTFSLILAAFGIAVALWGYLSRLMDQDIGIAREDALRQQSLNEKAKQATTVDQLKL